MLQAIDLLPTAGRRCRWLLAAVWLSALVGCREEPISSYRAPKDPPLPNWAVDDGPRVRMLVAMIPHGDKVWFFKLVGLDPVVTAQVNNFEQFVRSIRFPDAPAKDLAKKDAPKPVDWKLPAGWTDVASSQANLATIHIGSDSDQAELTVSALGAAAPQAGDVLSNVNRWRRQLGYVNNQGELQAVTSSDLGFFAFEHSMPCGKVTVVDLVSVPLPAGSRGLPKSQQPAGPPDEMALPGIKYELPAGWQKSDEPSQFAILTLYAGPAKRAAKVTISPLSGRAGGVLDNVNRWRGQIGLGPIALEEVPKFARKIILDGQPAVRFQFVSEETEASQRQAIVAILMPRLGTTWFVKLSGPADTVLAEAPAFEKFSKSIRFAAEGSPDEKPEEAPASDVKAP